MDKYNFSECSSFFSACQIGAEIKRRMQYADSYSLNLEKESDFINIEYTMNEVQADLVRLEIAASIICQAMRSNEENIENNSSNDLINKMPPEFILAFYHNILGIEEELNYIYENIDESLYSALRRIWENIVTEREYYRTELSPLFEKYGNIITRTEQDFLESAFSDNFMDLSNFRDDALQYGYSLICSASQFITVNTLNRTIERHTYKGVIKQLNEIRNNNINGNYGKSNKMRSVCVVRVEYKFKTEWFCAVSGLWDRSELGTPWVSDNKKNSIQSYWAQTDYEKSLEKLLNNIIKRMSYKTQWCKTAKNIECYFDKFDEKGLYEKNHNPIFPLANPLSLLNVLKDIFIYGRIINDWKRLFSCGERKVLSKIEPKLNCIDKIEFFVDRAPCRLCSYSMEQIEKNNHWLKIDVKYVP